MAAAAVVPMPVIAAVTVNHGTIPAVVTIGIVAIPVAGIISAVAVAISVSDRHPKADPNVHTRLCLRRACECERAEGQRDQKKFLQVHDEASVDVIEY